MRWLRQNKLLTQKVIEIILSSLIVLLSYLVPLHVFDYDTSNFKSFNFLALFIVAIVVIIFLVAEYTNGEKISKSRNILKVLLCSLTITMLITVSAFFLRGFSFPRSLIVTGLVIQFLILSFTRVIFRSFNRKLIFNSILVIGRHDQQGWLFKKAQLVKLPSETVDGYFSVDKLGAKLHDVLRSYTKVFISDEALKYIDSRALSLVSNYSLEIVIIPRKYEISVWGAVLIPLGDSLAMSIKNFGLSFEARAIKRLFDVVLSVVITVLTAPVMLVVALAIYLEDRNSPFFIQERVTKDGKKFKLIKFRSMKANAESETGAVWASSDDDRITKVGKIIRPIWLDELPQFLNVIKGDMSIVGPRPERQELIEEFVKDTPEFLYRTKVKAGITGYAQVLTSYETLPENKLKLDLLYIRRWSLVFDLLIIIETVRVICMKVIGLFLSSKEIIDNKKENQINENYIEYSYE